MEDFSVLQEKPHLYADLYDIFMYYITEHTSCENLKCFLYSVQNCKKEVEEFEKYFPEEFLLSVNIAYLLFKTNCYVNIHEEKTLLPSYFTKEIILNLLRKELHIEYPFYKKLKDREIRILRFTMQQITNGEDAFLLGSISYPGYSLKDLKTALHNYALWKYVKMGYLLESQKS